jgi:hypothetical protein
MLMRALLVHIAHETAGAARIRHSLRPLDFEGVTFPAKLGRNARRECGGVFFNHSRHHPRKRVIQYSRDVNDRTEKPQSTGSSAFADDDSFV